MAHYELLFPECKSFSELFAKVATERAGVSQSYIRHGGARVKLGPYCMVSGARGYHSLYVEPTEQVIAAIEKDWVGDERRDAIVFEVVIRDDGTALILSQNNLILASRWLALVPADTVPVKPEE